MTLLEWQTKEMEQYNLLLKNNGSLIRHAPIFEELKKPGRHGCKMNAIPGYHRHCETILLNSTCQYLDYGCKGCTIRKKQPKNKNYHKDVT